MNTEEKNWNPKNQEIQGNQSGSTRINTLGHAQRIATETTNVEYNVATSPRHLEQVKRYADLIGNCKN